MRTKFLVKSIFLVCVIVACLCACNSGSGTALATPDQIYTMHGRLVRMPDPGKEPRELMIHHEALPNFRNAQGEVDPMPEMTMPFPLASFIALDGFAPGDEVEFRYEVRWKSQPHEQVSALKKVPHGTAHLSDSGKGE